MRTFSQLWKLDIPTTSHSDPKINVILRGTLYDPDTRQIYELLGYTITTNLTLFPNLVAKVCKNSAQLKSDVLDRVSCCANDLDNLKFIDILILTSTSSNPITSNSYPIEIQIPPELQKYITNYHEKRILKAYKDVVMVDTFNLKMLSHSCNLCKGETGFLTFESDKVELGENAAKVLQIIYDLEFKKEEVEELVVVKGWLSFDSQG